MLAPAFRLAEELGAIKNPSEIRWGLKIYSVTMHLPQTENPFAPHDAVHGEFTSGQGGK
jgi:hypothetical protein